MKTLFRVLAPCAMALSILAVAIPAIMLGAASAEAQSYHGRDEVSDAEIRRGLARRAATSQSPEARRYRAMRRAEIRDERRHDDHRANRHDRRHDRRCDTVYRDGRRYRVCRD